MTCLEIHFIVFFILLEDILLLFPHLLKENRSYPLSIERDLFDEGFHIK